jgi:hypothetical protein
MPGRPNVTPFLERLLHNGFALHRPVRIGSDNESPAFVFDNKNLDDLPGHLDQARRKKKSPGLLPGALSFGER